MEKPSKREANISLQFPIIRRVEPSLLFYMKNKVLRENLWEQYTPNRTQSIEHNNQKETRISSYERKITSFKLIIFKNVQIGHNITDIFTNIFCKNRLLDNLF